MAVGTLTEKEWAPLQVSVPRSACQQRLFLGLAHLSAAQVCLGSAFTPEPWLTQPGGSSSLLGIEAVSNLNSHLLQPGSHKGHQMDSSLPWAWEPSSRTSVLQSLGNQAREALGKAANR